MNSAEQFETIVTAHYAHLFKFAMSLTRSESDASDLTQQTFYVWATKGHQLRDGSKVKTWLFTTLHREFLNLRRRAVRFPHHELSEIEHELPVVSPTMVNALDATKVVELLNQVAAPYQAPLALFYLEDYSYRDIADILDVPLGTVQSRISRGMSQLQQLIVDSVNPGSGRKKASRG